MTNAVEKIQEAIKACEEISAKDLNAQKEEIAKKFCELQKAVYEIIDEKGIILANYKWKQKKTVVEGFVGLNQVLHAEAQRISICTGYSYETIRDLLDVKNAFNHTERYGLYGNEYEFWTIDV